ncbi:hypothetical protein Vretimale_16791 [Volvox reticuliferus]|uniref:Beta-carotene isomerase D27-like C-terminal domain-containing protein n=1 Tax=Volvox reticuliferus TaxID=1737510 RepID=A0A8J4FY67_9CHLO|nr:hypothetical protein Vretifemale_18546 [Volvox reticuliferus]GIM13721.1 hypothetical protein Vretimale_16791 [Volvox reticuliferus]
MNVSSLRKCCTVRQTPLGISALQNRKVVMAGAADVSSTATTVKKDPFAEKTTYNDNFLDKLFIKLYSKKMADQLPGVTVPSKPTYDDFVRISSEIMKGRNSVEQRAVVREVLMSLLPPEAPPTFRKLFPPTQFSAEFNALIASLGFYWLVGESEVKEEEVVVGPNGATRRQRSVVQIKKCRYLESSGCVGMCVNMCKIPTQTFFTDEFGLPLTMNPNFEDLSCSMIFGQAPPPMNEDPAYNQPCFAVQCSIANRTDGAAPPPCPKVDTERSKARSA